MKILKSLFCKFYSFILPICGMLILTACDMTTNMDLESTQDQMNSVAGCFSCQFFRVVYNAAAQMASLAYPRLCDIAMSLLAIGLMLWILWHVLQLVTSMREPNLAQFWIQLFQMLFKGTFVAILVATKERLFFVVNSFMEPIGMIIIELSNTLLTSNWVSRISLTANLNSSFNSGPGFSAKIGEQLEVLIYRITVALNTGRVFGARLMLGSDFSNFWLGLVMTLIFLLMTLFFPLYLLDSVIRLAFVFTLLPLFLVAWIFKPTEHYLKKAWTMFLSAFLQIMGACIFVAICVSVFEGFISIRGYSHLLSPAAQASSAAFMDDAKTMSFSFLSFMLIAFYMYNLSKRVSIVTSHFTGAPSSNVMNKAIEKAKAVMKAVVLTAVAVAASATGLGAIGRAAAKNAQETAKNIAKDSVNQ